MFFFSKFKQRIHSNFFEQIIMLPIWQIEKYKFESIIEIDESYIKSLIRRLIESFINSYDITMKIGESVGEKKLQFI